MNLVLLAGAHPKRCNNGPRVRLQAGTWKAHFDGVKDSTFVLSFESGRDAIHIQHDSEFVLEKPEVVHVGFTNRGTENSLTINVKKIK